MTITFNDDENDFAPLPDGPQQATVFDSTIEREDGTKPHLSVQFRISREPYINRRVWERYWFTPKAIWRLKKLLVATGNMGAGFSGEFDENDIPGNIAGKAVTIVLSTDDYNPDKPRNRVDSVDVPEEITDLPF